MTELQSQYSSPRTPLVDTARPLKPRPVLGPIFGFLLTQTCLLAAFGLSWILVVNVDDLPDWTDGIPALIPALLIIGAANFAAGYVCARLSAQREYATGLILALLNGLIPIAALSALQLPHTAAFSGVAICWGLLVIAGSHWGRLRNE